MFTKSKTFAFYNLTTRGTIKYNTMSLIIMYFFMTENITILQYTAVRNTTRHFLNAHVCISSSRVPSNVLNTAPMGSENKF